MYRILLALLPVLLVNGPAYAQNLPDTLRVGMEEVIAIAQSDAPDVQIARTAYNEDYWGYQFFLANFRPQIILNGNVPNFNRTINVITLPDGTNSFIEQFQMTNDLSISLEQDIPGTGGTVFASTGLSRLDIFETPGAGEGVSYRSSPVSIGFIQPLFDFNPMKWQRKIEPIAFEEAKRVYSEDMEEVAFQSVQLYFDVLIAQLNLEAARRDRADADTLYAISKGRFEVGRIAETELLQFELNAMNADAQLSESTLNYQTSTERLRDFLGIQEAVVFQLETPRNIPDFTITPERALRYAQGNRSDPVSFDRRLMQAQQEVARAKGESGLSVDLFMSFGLSQSGKDLSSAYTDLLDQERVDLGFQIPIADWGKDRARRQIAQSQLERAQSLVARDRVSFQREVLVRAQQIRLLRKQVEVALRSYEVAQKRRTISRQRYLIGKILVTDLNIAISEEIAARRNYINALRDFWVAYYELRRLTLYDFINDRPLLSDPGRAVD